MINKIKLYYMKSIFKTLVILISLSLFLNSCKTISPTEAANGKAKCGKKFK